MLLPFWLPCRLYLSHPIFISWHWKISLFQFSFFLEIHLLILGFWVLMATEGALAPMSFPRTPFPQWTSRSCCGWVLGCMLQRQWLASSFDQDFEQDYCHLFPHVLKQDFSTLALWTFGKDNSLLYSCLMPCRLFSSTPGPYQSEARCLTTATLPPPFLQTLLHVP